MSVPGDLYARVFSRAMERDVPEVERQALRSVLHDLGAGLRPALRRRPHRMSLFGELITEAIDDRIHGSENDEAPR